MGPSELAKGPELTDATVGVAVRGECSQGHGHQLSLGVGSQAEPATDMQVTSKPLKQLNSNDFAQVLRPSS